MGWRNYLRSLIIMYKQKGMATLIALGFIVGAFITGTLAVKYSERKDGVLEQISEKVLDYYGIEYDFSFDKDGNKVRKNK